MISFLRLWLCAVVFMAVAPLVTAQVSVETITEPEVLEVPAENPPASGSRDAILFPDNGSGDAAGAFTPAAPQAEIYNPAFPATRESRDRLNLPSKESIGYEELSNAVRSPERAEDNFNALRDLRNRIGAALERVQDEVWKAERRIAGIPLSIDIEQWIENTEENIACARDPECQGWREEDLRYLNSDQRRNQNDLLLAQEAEKDFPLAQDLLSDLELLADELDRKINAALNRDIVEQKFKTDVSLYFTAIVGVMIVLFFGLLFYDENVRKSLFSTPSAIQFVTLFSVVIAIILFGITGILQDKELSALLGGLSGYILGRYSNDTPAST